MAGEESNGNGRLLARVDERTKLMDEKLDRVLEKVEKHEERIGAVEKEQARQGVYSGLIATFFGGLVGAITGFFGPRP